MLRWLTSFKTHQSRVQSISLSWIKHLTLSTISFAFCHILEKCILLLKRSWYKVWSWPVSLNKSQSSMCPHVHTPQFHLQTRRWHNRDHILLSYAQVMSALFLIPKAVSEGRWERDIVCRSEPWPSHKSSHVRAANPKRAERHSSLTHMLSQQSIYNTANVTHGVL